MNKVRFFWCAMNKVTGPLERAQSVAHRTRQAAAGEEAALRIGMATSALYHVLPRLRERVPRPPAS